MSMGGGMGEGMTSPLLGGAGDIVYPHYLANGRVPSAPVTLSAKPGQRARLRLINAGSDTAFRVALGGHRLTVAHSDGFPVMPITTDSLLIGMGERYDVLVTVANGVFPLVALAEGKKGNALALVRSAAGTPPPESTRPAELTGKVILITDLMAADAVRLKTKAVDRSHALLLSGSMAPYRWTINGKTFPDADPLPVEQGQRVRLRFQNMSMMFHPMHVHGHTFALVGGGARKDTPAPVCADVAERPPNSHPPTQRRSRKPSHLMHFGPFCGQFHRMRSRHGFASRLGTAFLLTSDNNSLVSIRVPMRPP